MTNDKLGDWETVERSTVDSTGGMAHSAGFDRSLPLPQLGVKQADIVNR